MVNYNNGLIYTIRTGDSVYVGSTCNFNRRKQQHKQSIYNENSKEYGIKLYKTIRDNDGEWDIKPYKEFPCENKIQLTIEEERVRVGLNADLNSYTCHGQDKNYSKNYYIENKEKVKQYYIENKEKRKDHYEKNKEEFREKNKQYYENNKESVGEKNKQYYENNIETVKEKQKQYYENNKEEIREKQKDHYEKNKEEILEKQKEKTVCECGCEVAKGNLKKHKQTAKHIKMSKMGNP